MATFFGIKYKALVKTEDGWASVGTHGVVHDPDHTHWFGSKAEAIFAIQHHQNVLRKIVKCEEVTTIQESEEFLPELTPGGD